MEDRTRVSSDAGVAEDAAEVCVRDTPAPASIKGAPNRPH